MMSLLKILGSLVPIHNNISKPEYVIPHSDVPIEVADYSDVDTTGVPHVIPHSDIEIDSGTRTNCR